MHIVLILVNGKCYGIVVIVKTQCKLLKCAHIAQSHTGHRESNQHFVCVKAIRYILNAGSFLRKMHN